ncbi:LysR family transcriptional regulator [Psychrobacillus sp. NPDC093180]|uniref:LysR family transcriptional regulator n=1 Tax=Psychrobacillus sp. NPDC093180 TaxID=3364489 RepID=UPI0037F6EA6D
MYSYQIEVFVAVVENGSFSKAANQLYVSTTAIMKQINLLEDRLKMTLLKRTSQGITLTPAGESLYKDAKEIMELSEKAIQKAHKLAAESTYTIRIGTSFLNPVKPFMPIWNKINEFYPQFKLQIIPFEDDHSTIMETIRTLGTRFDCIFGACDSKQWLEYCQIVKLGSFQLSCAFPSDHPLANRNIIRLEDLHGERLMMVSAGDSQSNDELRSFIKEHHSEIIIIDLPNHYDLEVFNACEQTGSVLLTLDGWEDIHPSLVTIPLDWDGNPPSFGLIYDKKPNDAMRKLIQAVNQVQSRTDSRSLEIK